MATPRAYQSGLARNSTSFYSKLVILSG
jgi:hypothetical protein